MIRMSLNLNNLSTHLTDKYDNLTISDNPKWSVLYEVVSGTLLHFLPKLSAEEHKQLFRKILYYQELGILLQNDNQDFQSKIESDPVSNQKLEFLRTNSAILCTLHMGLHREIVKLLARYKISFSILLSGAAYQEYKSQIEQWSYKVKNSIQLLNADSPSVIFQMLRRLNSGECILFYLDGQSGLAKTEEMSKIEFLNQEIRVRNGIAFLAQKAKVPVLPVLSYMQNGNEVLFRFFDIIYPERRFFSEPVDIIQHIYNNFSELILKFPEQWEGWLTLHKTTQTHQKPAVMCSEEIAEHVSNDYLFNHKYFGLLCHESNYYILRKSDMMAFRISYILYEALKMNPKEVIKKEIIDVYLFNELLLNKVLLPV